MDKSVSHLIEKMLFAKETIIKDAINSILGKNNYWVLTRNEIKARSVFKILPDKTEIFSFDGIDLIHFYHIETNFNTNDEICLLKIKQKYKILWENKL